MTEQSSQAFKEFITATVGSQLFGLPILRVQDVFVPERIARVPLAGADIAGVLNLRGRIVTLIDVRRRLGLPARANEAQPMAIGVEARGESYGLLVDAVGEVVKLDEASLEANPVNLDAELAAVSAGIFRLEGQLLVVIDVDRVLDLGTRGIAA